MGTGTGMRRARPRLVRSRAATFRTPQTATTRRPQPIPEAAEVCDGLDNDCDGTVDGAAQLGSGSQCAAGNCKEILDSQPASADGTYWLDPTGSDPIEIYCDMTNDGGGWTLIGKLAGGNYSSTSDADYIDLIANPIAHVNLFLLQSAGLPSQIGQIAFLDRDTTNALYHSGFGVVRVELNTPANTAANGVYFQQKTNASSSWDLWHALRDSTQWGSGTSSNFVSGFGSDFVLGKGSSSHNPTTGAVTHQGDGSFGFWDHVTITLGNGESLSVSRHFGLACDGGHGSQGDQWMATGNPADSSLEERHLTLQ